MSVQPRFGKDAHGNRPASLELADGRRSERAWTGQGWLDPGTAGVGAVNWTKSGPA